MEFRGSVLLRWVLSIALFFSVSSFSGCNSRTSFHQHTAKTEEAINYKDFSGTRKLFYKRSLTELIELEKKPAKLRIARAGVVRCYNATNQVRFRGAARAELPGMSKSFSAVKTIPQATDEPFLSPAGV